jgi:phosphoglycerol transferase MdoB-like AlkP superfamily enzyme
MVDVTGGAADSGSRTGYRWSALRVLTAIDGLSFNAVCTLSALTAAAIAFSFYLYEGTLGTVGFTTAVTLCLAALVAAATRRLLLTTVLIASFIGLLNYVASAKRETLGMVLHAYDLVFYLGSWSTVTYLWQAAPGYLLAFGGGLVVSALLCWLACRLDRTRLRRAPALGLALVAGIAAATAGASKAERRQTQFYWDALYVTSFYSSWAETAETLWRGQLVEAATGPSAAPFALAKQCAPATKPPHIVLIHQESVVQPSLFPQLAYNRGLDPFFQSGDGQLRKLRVETYGGASWLTEFSILTGLSTHAFGGMRPFVQSLLAGKVRDTLPEALARCGYRNVMFYPMLRNFVSNARFYDAIGLREIFDLKAQGAPSAHERDTFYYRNALAEMERHMATSSKPLFTYIQTMSAHWPYDYKFAPEMDVPGGGPGTDAEMNEYLRRLAISKVDLDAFEAELKQRFPDRPILLVHYGDHHPMATRKLLGFREETDVEDVEMAADSIGFTTYYAVKTLNHSAPALPPVAKLDVPWLGAVILQQAGLPLSEAWTERLRLMTLCEGRYNGCSRNNEIMGFHRRLIDSRLLDSR